MARRGKKSFNPLGFVSNISLPSLELEPQVKRNIFIVFLLAAGIMGYLSIFNEAGLVGLYYHAGLKYFFGWGKVVFPFLLVAFAYLLYKEDEYALRSANYVGLFLFILSAQALLQLFVPYADWQTETIQGGGGGKVGLLLAAVIAKLVGYWAAWVLVISFILISLILIFNTTLSKIIGGESIFGRSFSALYARFTGKLVEREGEEGDGEEEEEEEESGEDDEEEAGDGEEEEEEEESGEDDEEEAGDGEEEEDGDNEDGKDEAGERHVAGSFLSKAIKGDAAADLLERWTPTGVNISLPLGLLVPRKGRGQGGDVKRNMEIIQKTFENFHIQVEMGEYNVGPTVTQYTMRPAEGIKLSRIIALAENLALALAAHPVRIEAPIPGKSLVGIEVPNQTKAIVGLREVLETKEFKQKKQGLAIGLGKDVMGKAWIAEVIKMPHLLIAGQTQSGKSVCLNAVIASLLFQNNPDDLRFIMVDPKHVELINYNGIPHLLTPVINNVEGAVNALNWCIGEMETRYAFFSRRHKKNIQHYNETARIRLPYIVFVVDEMADLMTMAGREMEQGVMRITQKGRAAGIHMVLATQSPRVDIITGIIKANMPARIAFSVSSGIDSRTILDSLGAEKLIGSGDMLYLNTELSKPKRIQGAFLSEAEIMRIVRTIKEQAAGVSTYQSGITEKQGGSGALLGIRRADTDPLYEQAIEVVMAEGRGSTALLQRKLSVGYGRGAKIIDRMVEDGILSSESGSKGRELLIPREQYERLKAQGVSGMPIHRRDETTPPASYLGDEEEDDNDDDLPDEDGASEEPADEGGGEDMEEADGGGESAELEDREPRQSDLEEAEKELEAADDDGEPSPALPTRKSVAVKKREKEDLLRQIAKRTNAKKKPGVETAGEIEDGGIFFSR